MRILLLFVLFPVIFACSDSTAHLQTMQAQINELQKNINEVYKPGFGEFMGTIQVHHAKLWFAGINNNWKLADFEIHEIMETIQDLEKYQTERPEIQSLPVVYPALDSVNSAIDKQDPAKFRQGYTILTNTCNTCHRAVNYGFNNVKIPDNPPFSNQVFKTVTQINQSPNRTH
jgi:hypothetical protein